MTSSTRAADGCYIREYYRQIEAGEAVVSDKVRRVYKELVRLLDDDSGEWVYDERRAQHPITFVEKYCKHSKGASTARAGSAAGRLSSSSGRRRLSPLSSAS